jgi:nitrate reductase cytochrome c-type subunit
MRVSSQFKLILLFLLTGIISGCLTTSPKVFQGKNLVTGKPGMNVYPANPPGETTTLKRPYDGAPPMVPHSISGSNINRTENDCIGCHLEGMTLSVGHTATKIPQSHYNNGYTGEHKDTEVIGIRHNCLQCHVPQSTAELF